MFLHLIRNTWNPYPAVAFDLSCSFILVPSGHLPPMRCLLACDPAVSRTTASNFREADPTTQQRPFCASVLQRADRNIGKCCLTASVWKVTSKLSTFEFNSRHSFRCSLDLEKLRATTSVASLLRSSCYGGGGGGLSALPWDRKSSLTISFELPASFCIMIPSFYSKNLLLNVFGLV